MPDNRRQGDDASGGIQEKFWGKGYDPKRFENPDGTTVPLYDQVLIEEDVRRRRFDPLTSTRSKKRSGE